MYLLDTNIISETRRPAKINPNVQSWLDKIDSGLLLTSVVVLMELEKGVLHIERKDKQQGVILRRWLEEVVKPTFIHKTLPIDQQTATLCAALHIPNKAPENDAWIAATALQHGLTLVTRNTKDFEQTGVKLFNPFQAA